MILDTKAGEHQRKTKNRRDKSCTAFVPNNEGSAERAEVFVEDDEDAEQRFVRLRQFPVALDPVESFLQ